MDINKYLETILLGKWYYITDSSVNSEQINVLSDMRDNARFHTFRT